MSRMDRSNEEVAEFLRDLAAEIEAGGDATRKEAFSDLHRLIRSENGPSEMPPRTRDRLMDLSGNATRINKAIEERTEGEIASMPDIYRERGEERVRLELELWEPELAQILALVEGKMQHTEEVFELAMANALMMEFIAAAPETHARIAEEAEQRQEERRKELLGALQRANENSRMQPFIESDAADIEIDADSEEEESDE